MLNGWLNGRPTQGSCEDSAGQECAIGNDQTLPAARNSNSPKSEPIQKNHMGKNRGNTSYAVEVNTASENGHAGLHDAVSKGHIEMVKILIEGGGNVYKPDAQGWNRKALAEHQGNKSTYDLSDRNEQEKMEKAHEIDLNGQEIVGTSTYRQNRTASHEAAEYLESHTRRASSLCKSNHLRYYTDQESTKKRVTIHMQVPSAKTSTRHLAKLIILPSSIEELLRVAGELYLMCTESLISQKAETRDC